MDAVLTSQPEPEGRLHGVVPTHVLIYITCSHRKGLTEAIGGAQPKSAQQRCSRRCGRRCSGPVIICEAVRGPPAPPPRRAAA